MGRQYIETLKPSDGVMLAVFILDRWDTPPKPERAGHANNEREELRVVRMQLCSWGRRTHCADRSAGSEIVKSAAGALEQRVDLIIARDPAGIQTPDYSNS